MLCLAIKVFPQKFLPKISEACSKITVWLFTICFRMFCLETKVSPFFAKDQTYKLGINSLLAHYGFVGLNT